MNTDGFLKRIKELGPIYNKARKDRDISQEQFIREELAILLVKFGPTKSALRGEFKLAEANRKKCIKQKTVEYASKGLKLTAKIIEAKSEIDCDEFIQIELEAGEAYDAAKEASDNCVHIMNAIASKIKLTVNSEVHV